ncbi:MAG: nitroreductase family protein [Candidatus Omnitrophica bacterium]|nr:nitroreductase family protein [Candidatus Omnitrophota bacterium]
MDFFETINKRRSVRSYSRKLIDKEEIKKIIDAGRLAPTARCEEPWEFVVVTQRERLEALAAITDHGKFMASASAGVFVLCKNTKYYLEDGCAATENILLAAASLGIGSCWIAGDKKAYADKILKILKAPQDYKLISIISLGYPAEGAIDRDKRDLEDVLHWEEF